MNKKKIFQLSKNFQGRLRHCWRLSKQAVEKALQYSYRDRRRKKREFRKLWIQKINAGSRQYGVRYSTFMHGLMKENIQLDRKVLSEIAMNEPISFKALVDIAKVSNPVKVHIPVHVSAGLPPPPLKIEEDEEEDEVGLKMVLTPRRKWNFETKTRSYEYIPALGRTHWRKNKSAVN